MFGEPEVSLIMPATGGTGAAHLVDMLDYQLIRAHPKLFTGFSNPTVLNNSILAAAGLPSVHGVSGFQFFGWPDVDEPTETAFWRMVSGPITGHEVTGEDWRAYRADRLAVSGPVVGGSLWDVSALPGTRWLPSTSGAILLLEAVDATFEQVDRLLTQLRLARVFDDIAALVIGAPADWAAENAPDASADELVLRCVKGRFPVITGVEFGHQHSKIQFPVGCRVEFDLRGEYPVLRYLEELVTLDL
jgi:muramoyltetrapeptide carboxypeptidase